MVVRQNFLCGLSLAFALLLLACDSDQSDDSAVFAEGPTVEADSGPPDPDKQMPPSSDGPDPSVGPVVSAEGNLDYSDPQMWLCRPGLDWDWCLTDMDATELLPDGTGQVEEHEPDPVPDFDCFYIYPTVAPGPGPYDLDFAPANKLNALSNQAARLTSMCRVFAPLYRQITLGAGGAMGGMDRTTPLTDLFDAFDHYMENYNDGRKFVLLGHSQGSNMLIDILNMRFEGDPALQAQMIAAWIVGANVHVPTGEVAGGTFPTIPICTEGQQTGCVVSWVTYANDGPPPANARFGEDPPDGTAVCTSPLELAGNAGKLKGSYFAAGPADETPWLVYRDAFRASCVTRDGFSYLEVTLDLPSQDMRAEPGWRNPAIEDLGLGLHLVDWNLAMGDALDLIRIQADAALAP